MVKKVTTNFGDLSMIDLMYALPEEDCTVLVLATAGYVDGTQENQTDLLDKLEGYLVHIQSEQFRNDYPQSTVFIDVTFQEKPHVLITDLLYKCTSWCRENGAILRFQIGKDYYRFS